MSERVASDAVAGADKKVVDVREDFTNRLIQSLENGVIPWRKEWKEVGISDMPRNAVTGKDYRGGNRLILLMEGMDRRYADPRWLTFKQAKDLGGGIAKGEHGVRIEYWDKMPFWKRRDVEITKDGKRVFVDAQKGIDGSMVPLKGGEMVLKSALTAQHDGKQYSWRQAESQLDMLYAKSHVVFNAEQCRDLQLDPLAKVSEIEGFEKAKAIVAGMENDGVKINHTSDRAFYRPGADTVTMPAPDQFTSPEAYYSTLLHELGHSTGHKDRLDRQQLNTFGSEEYAKEELVAELASAFTSIETGVKFDDANHAAYVGSWLQALKNDKNEIFRAAKHAGQAADFLIEHSIEPKQEVEINKAVDIEKDLRDYWTKSGVSQEKQDALVAEIAAKAAPGAAVGPFRVQEDKGMER